ncbi:hypothetical protein [Jiulongibacter sediminis]|jgi:hypothetical protein|uniref:hypothetical protein n=1 Tax=Jiulongibacter sediminis TaxID=1605367 RepID=UPI0026EF6592|nr:hypothetical protein [Jiulongibacter sediminis]
MKKIIGALTVLSLLISCEKKDSTPKLDLTGFYTGTVKGYAQPVQIDGFVNLEVTHLGDSVKALVSSPENSANGGWLTYQAVVIGDSVLLGSFKEAYAKPSIVNGKIVNNGNQLLIETNGADASYNYFRVKIDVLKQP